ncbi:MAG: ECF transporter S component [Peptostreptococcaceae bacterium]|nr:ECF transporter S component [Peptostreptococcaceae bacterium]
MKRASSTNKMVKTSVLSVIAFVLMLIELPVPLFPVFLKLDLSDLPALVGGFAMGPAAGVAIELIKNFLHFITRTSTAGVGELANFIVGAALVFPASYIYKMKKSKTQALKALAVGTVSMAIAGGLANYFILLPFYAKVMPLDIIIEKGNAANAAIHDMKTLVLYAIVPFNLIKGAVISAITLLIYKKISVILHK